MKILNGVPIVIYKSYSDKLFETVKRVIKEDDIK